MDNEMESLPMELSEEDIAAIEQIRREALAQRNTKLEALAETLRKLRQEAIDYRKLSGVEDRWQAAQDAYEGVDDANRLRRTTEAWSTKPPGQTSPNDRTTRSTVFLNITRPYTDASAARVSDMLTPTDDRSFGISATPKPELVDLKSSEQVFTMPDGRRVAERDIAAKILEKAQAKAKKAEERIDYWLVQSKHHGESRKVVHDCARLGVGVFKGPVPKTVRKIAIMETPEGYEVVVNEKIQPTSMRMSPWNLYPDPSCGENIHNGSWVWERDTVTKRELRELKKEPGYLPDQIDLCVEEGPQRPEADPRNHLWAKKASQEHTPFEIWYFTGFIDRDDLEACGCDVSDFEEETVPAIMTMCNTRIIRASLNPLDSGAFPYDTIPWQEVDGSWCGIGVAEQLNIPQRMINAGTRNMMDNAGVSSGPQIVIKRGTITPANGQYELTPRKVWYMASDSSARISDVFLVVNIPSMQRELLEIIEFALRMAEDVTGLPMLLQGQMGKAPETVGGMTLLFNNASSVLRRMARLYDDRITIPHIGRYYDYLMQYGEDEEKGDFQINARGSSVLAERDMQAQALLQMFPMSQNPMYRIDPEKYSAEVIKTQKIEPHRIQYDDDKWEVVQKAMQEQPEAPQVIAAQIGAQIKQAEQQLEQFKTMIKAQSEEKDRENLRWIEQLRAQVQLADQQGRQVINVNDLRGMLTKTTVQERNKSAMLEREIELKMNPKNKSGEGI